MTTIKIEKDEDLILKNRRVSINGKEVGVIYLKNNEWAFVPLIQNKEFDSAAYYPLNFELMLAVTNEIETLNKRFL